MPKTPLSLIQFGELFRVIVEQSDFTLKEVCEYTGIPDQYPSKWRKGYGRIPDYQQIGKVSTMLEVPVEILIYGPSGLIHINSAEYEKLVQDRQNLIYALGQFKNKHREDNEPENRQN